MTTTNESTTLRDLLRVLFRHKWFAGAFFLLAIGGTIAGLIISPRIYESSAKLFVRVGRENSSLDPTASQVGKQITLNETRESEINSLLEILKSRTLVEYVVDDLGLEALQRSAAGEATPAAARPASAAAEASWLGSAQEWCAATAKDAWAWTARVLRIEAIDAREQMVAELDEALEIWSPRKSNVISITCRWRSPEMAQRIVDSLLKHYLERHAEVHRTRGAYEFFHDQAVRLHDELTQVKAQLRDELNAGDMAALEARQRQIHEQLAEIETSALRNAASLAETQARVTALQAGLKRLPERLVAQEVDGHPNVGTDAMRANLYALELQQQELASKFTDEHPQVQAIQAQVAAAKAILARQDPDRKQKTFAVNPARQKLEQDLLAEQALLAALAARRDTLVAQRGQVREQLVALNARATTIDELQRRAGLLETSYRSYAETLEQARIDRQLEIDRISNVSIVESPTYITKPTSPKRLMIIGAGLAIAVLGSLGVAFVAEYFDRSIKTQDEAEATLDLPVLANIPRTAGHRLSLN